MYKVSDSQVDFILSEIRSRGVEIEDLQFNLLDHMCCIIENEMSETEDFELFFQKLLPRFFRTNLREVQEETTLLLTFKHFYAMKKMINISGALSAGFLLTGILLKIGHLPGAGIGIVLGSAFFILLFLPVVIALKMRDDSSRTDNLVLSFGLLVGMVTAAGVIFKLMHWPLANILSISGLSTFVFVYVPIYFLTRIRRPELKLNTVVNSVLMMAAGGLLFAMFNLRSTSKTTEKAGKSAKTEISAQHQEQLRRIAARSL